MTDASDDSEGDDSDNDGDDDDSDGDESDDAPILFEKRKPKASATPSTWRLLFGDNPPGRTPRQVRASRRQSAGRASTASLSARQRKKQLRYPLPLELPQPALVDAMSNQQGKWKEEQVLVICPGSQTTLAQLGCHELTLPAHRIPTRMFKDPDTGGYLPYHTYKRKKAGVDAATQLDSEDEYEYVEDRDSTEGAIYPISRGHIANMEAFLAFLDHVHSLLTTSYHNTPIVLVASPQWTRPDHETVARFIFEKTKTPALCLLHNAFAAQYGLKWTNLTVVDIGYEKVDVTCLWDSNVVAHKHIDDRVSGGEFFTQKLLALLKDKAGFTYDMAEQLKKSPLCEVLPYAANMESLMELPDDDVASATANAEVPGAGHGTEPAKPVAPALSANDEGESSIVEDKSAEEGVLDVANIVTTGNARDFIAKREKEKAEKEKAKGKKAKAQAEADAAANKPIRLPNSKRKTNTFHYEEVVHEDVQVPLVSSVPKPEPAAATAAPDAAAESAPQPAPAPTNGDIAMADRAAATGETGTPADPSGPPAAAVEGADSLPPVPETISTVTERRTKRVRKDIEVGLERFLFADREEIDRITTTIYNTVQSIGDISKRGDCWNTIVFVGNGSRLRGLKDNIMQTLQARHLISPSTATMFTSELPSNMATPTGTGSQTPTGSLNGQLPLPSTSSVNPLLQAATTASLGVPGAAQPGSVAGDVHGHQSHAQTPTSIKQATLPNYLQEWNKAGYEEAHFLGALVAARFAYCIHNMELAESTRLMSLNRVDYKYVLPVPTARLPCVSSAGQTRSASSSRKEC